MEVLGEGGFERLEGREVREERGCEQRTRMRTGGREKGKRRRSGGGRPRGGGRAAGFQRGGEGGGHPAEKEGEMGRGTGVDEARL